MSIIDHQVLKVAHIDCEKDTYQVQRQNITPFLNTELTKLIDGTEKVHIFFMENSDGVSISPTRPAGENDGSDEKNDGMDLATSDIAKRLFDSC